MGHKDDACANLYLTAWPEASQEPSSVRSQTDLDAGQGKPNKASLKDTEMRLGLSCLHPGRFGF